MVRMNPYTDYSVRDESGVIEDRGILSDKVVDLVTGIRDFVDNIVQEQTPQNAQRLYHRDSTQRRQLVQPQQVFHQQPHQQGTAPRLSPIAPKGQNAATFPPPNAARRPTAGGEAPPRTYDYDRRLTATGDIPQRIYDGDRRPPFQGGDRRPTSTGNEIVTPDGEVLTPEEVKKRIQFIQKVMPNVSLTEIMETLKANDFHMKHTVEALVDRLTVQASQLMQSKMMVQQSVMLMENENLRPPAQAIGNSFVVAAQDDDFVYQPSNPVEGYKPAMYVSHIPNEFIPASGNKKALLIGINYYGSKNQLNGCCDDVDRMKKLMVDVYGFLDVPQRMTVLSDRPGGDPRLLPSRHNVLTAMKWLVAGARSGDILFFHYSGHGGQKLDLSGTEIDGFDETIMPLDYKKAGHITDDEMHITMIRDLPSGVKLVCVMDCCHSGSGMDLPFYWDGDKTEWTTEAFPKYSEGDVILFSSCQDAQTAADLKIPSWGSGGAVTMALAIALSQSPFDLSIADLLKRVDTFLANNRFSQQPQVSSTQKFDMSKLKFNMADILPNTNELVGYHKRRGGRRRRGTRR